LAEEAKAVREMAKEAKGTGAKTGPQKAQKQKETERKKTLQKL
jgi:hypothetical protein